MLLRVPSHLNTPDMQIRYWLLVIDMDNSDRNMKWLEMIEPTGLLMPLRYRAAQTLKLRTRKGQYQI